MARAARNGKVAEPVAMDGDVSDAGASTILAEAPYRVSVTLTGSSPILFHRWQSDAVEAKAEAAKGSREKKTDNIESYVWRNEEQQICLPGEYLRCTLVDQRNGAAKYRQDPRSPRKSALDLFRAGVMALTELAPIITVSGEPAMTWDYVDKRRAVVQRSGVARSRPAFAAGWQATVVLMCQSPTYIPPVVLGDTLNQAGKLVGLADFRPQFGRFMVTNFELLDEEEQV